MHMVHGGSWVIDGRGWVKAGDNRPFIHKAKGQDADVLSYECFAAWIFPDEQPR